MDKKLEKLELRNAKLKEFEQLLELAKTEKRQLTSDEDNSVIELKETIRQIDEELEILEVERKETEEKLEVERKAEEVEIERQAKIKEEEKLQIEKNKKNRNMEIEKNTIFDLFKRNLDNQNGGTFVARAAVDGDTTAMSASIPNYVKELDIVGYKPIWQEMGVDLMSGVKGTFTLPYEDPIIGALLAELATATGDTTTPTGILIQPRRYTVSKTFTLETLNSATSEFINSVLADMVKGCDRAITKSVYTKALAAASEVASGAITKVGFDALMAGAEVELDGSFLANRSTFFEAKSVALDAGSGRFLVERAGSNGQGIVYDGTPFWYSNLFEDGTDQQYVVYGDTSKVFVADYNSVEIIVDKFTLAKDGKVVITVNKIADVAIKNPIAFTKTPDLDVA